MFRRLKSLYRLLFCWQVSCLRLPVAFEPDCFIALAFGQQLHDIRLGDGVLTSGVVPGAVNELLAHLLVRNYLRAFHPSKDSPPLLLQSEFGETEAIKELIEMESAPRIYLLGKRLGYCNSYEILQEAQEIMGQQELRTAAMVAHPAHLLRCAWIAEKLGLRIVSWGSLNQDLAYSADIYLEGVMVPERQKQTTSKLRWNLYEPRARVHHWLHGWI